MFDRVWVGIIIVVVLACAFILVDYYMDMSKLKDKKDKQ